MVMMPGMRMCMTGMVMCTLMVAVMCVVVVLMAVLMRAPNRVVTVSRVTLDVVVSMSLGIGCAHD
jgi:hypothetical protein